MRGMNQLYSSPLGRDTNECLVHIDATLHVRNRQHLAAPNEQGTVMVVIVW